MPLENAPIKYEWNKLPEGWAKVIDQQVYSRSSSETVVYDTPKYKGTIVWSYNEFYGELASCFDFNGECLQANNGNKIHEVLNIPEDYCIRTGAKGYYKMLTRSYFQMWLQK